MKLIALVGLLLLIVSVLSKTQDSIQSDLLDKVNQFISKQGFRSLVHPKVLKAEIKLLIVKLAPKAAAKATAQHVPFFGIFAGLGFGAWRMLKGQFGRASAQIASGITGGLGMVGVPLLIDIPILIYDIVEALVLGGIIE